MYVIVFCVAVYSPPMLYNYTHAHSCHIQSANQVEASSRIKPRASVNVHIGMCTRVVSGLV